MQNLSKNDQFQKIALRRMQRIAESALYISGLSVRLLKERIGKEKIVEGPIAEGADLRGIKTLMMDFYDDRSFVRDLFSFV